MGSTWAVVVSMVCTTEGCTDSTSSARRFLRVCVRFGGQKLVDFPDESSFSKLKYFGLFRALFVDLGNTCCRASIGAEREGRNSAVWLVGGGAISISELCGAMICGADIEAVFVIVCGGAKFD